MRKHSNRKPRTTGLPMIFGLSEKMKTDLQITPLGTLESFREGTATEEGWHTIAAAVNLAAILSRKQPQEVQDECNAGLNALRSIAEREQRTGKYGCSGDEYQALRLALILGADMQEAMTRREVAQAINQTLREAGIQ